MRLKRIEIDNYKSLRGVIMEPGPLSVLVGPNAAGKTNFCEALDFLAHVYDWSLEKAVEFKGGYENICYRDGQGLSKGPIRFRVVVEQPAPSDDGTLIFDHVFEFGPEGLFSPRAPWVVIAEELTISPELRLNAQRALRLSRRGNRVEHSGFLDREATVVEKLLENERPSAGLILPMYAEIVSNSPLLTRHMAGMKVFQLSALGGRAPGIPTPNPNLDRFGGNLPAVILHLKRDHPDEYAQIVTSLRNVLPDVEDLDAIVTRTRVLALSLKQTDQSWPVEDLSDGTMQAMATLAAVFDPRIPLLVLEEPENNVHPWVIRAFAEAFRLASETKQIILTTHSPILIDQFKPEEVWIVQKPGPVTRIDPLLKLDPSLKGFWERGRFTLSEYLDSGALPEAVPAIA